jgi:hypothetical protein
VKAVAGDRSGTRGVPDRKYGKRRLFDMSLIAFHSACDQADIEAAWELLTRLNS